MWPDFEERIRRQNVAMGEQMMRDSKRRDWDRTKAGQQWARLKARVSFAGWCVFWAFVAWAIVGKVIREFF